MSHSPLHPLRPRRLTHAGRLHGVRRSGILWCFGLFDRPWAPERQVLGRIRYMSSANTAKKFRLGPYLAYVDSLPKPA